ncbi:MAG: hypothetical protein N2689_12880, partial [Verrucomicrobiae bacterium]|nr:hypothetical protein [Verrucomicrobiae bacterium]
YALMLMAERRFESARAALRAVADPQGERFGAFVAGVMAAQAEAEAMALLAALRAQIAARQWTNAFARLLALDLRYTNTTTFLAAGTELSAAHDQLLALPPAAGTADAAARVAVCEARRAVGSASWERALNLVNAADAQLAAVAPSG